LISTLFSCGDSSITSEYDTVKAKKIILTGDDGKEYEITINKKGVLVAKLVH
jgi:hypothetical protein